MSVTSYAPPAQADGPPPTPKPYNVWTVARDINNFRAPAGLNVIPYPCGTPRGHIPCGPGSTALKEADPPEDMPFFLGFTAYLATTCTRSAIGDDEEFKQKLEDALDATDHLAAESQLAFGTYQDGNPYLSDGNAVSLGGSGDPDEALALLEEAIAATGREGIIEAPPSVASAWGYDKLRNDGGVLRTVLGTPVVVSGGFGSGTAWATGPLLFERGPIEVIPPMRAQAVDRTINEVTYYAERNIVIGWDGCLQVEVDVDIAP